MSKDRTRTREISLPALGGLLRLAWQEHRERLYERLTHAGFPDVSRAQFALVRWPGIEGLRPIEIAEQVGLSKQAVNDLLGELERAGYARREPHPVDRRARVVRLTARGQELQRMAHELSREIEDSWAAVIGPDRLRVLRSTLEEMAAHVLASDGAGASRTPARASGGRHRPVRD